MRGIAQSGEAEIAYERTGSGPAVVLAHEGICDRRMWEPQVEPLVGAGYEVVRYDLRGFGESTLPPGRFAHVADLLRLLEALELGEAILVGASLGGRVALELALANPRWARALVLVGAGLREWKWSEAVRAFGEEEDALLDRGEIDAAVELNLRAWVDGPEREPGEVDPEVRRRVADMQRRAFEVQLAAFEQQERPGPEEPFDPPVSARLGEVSAPTLVLAGEKDQPDILETAELLAARIPRARKAAIPATAHVPNLERPAEFNRLLLEFLEEG